MTRARRKGPLRHAALISLWIGLAGAAALRAADPAPAPQALPSPGFHKMTLDLEGGGALRYSLFVPRLKPGEAAPLVLALHYGGPVRPYYSFPFLQACAAPGFESLDAVIVAPDCPGRGWTDPQSESAVLELLDLALRDWPVDRRRTVVTGFSMGGIGAWYLAERHPERFSAAVPVAGAPAGVVEGSIPVYAIHSSRDEVIDLEPTRRAIDALRGRGVTAELLVFPGPTHYETALYCRPLTRAAKWLRKLWAEPRPGTHSGSLGGDRDVPVSGEDGQ